MNYGSYLQIVKDINYMEGFDQNERHRHYGHFYEPEEYIDYRTVNKLKKEWLNHINEKYEDSIKVTVKLHKIVGEKIQGMLSKS